MSAAQWEAAALVLAVTLAVLLLGVEIGRTLGPRRERPRPSPVPWRVTRLADERPLGCELAPPPRAAAPPLPPLPSAGRFTFGGAGGPALLRDELLDTETIPLTAFHNPLPEIDAHMRERERRAADQVAQLEAEIWWQHGQDGGGAPVSDRCTDGCGLA